MKKLLASALLLTATVIGCGDLGQGDYNAYRIASSESKESGDCDIDDPTTTHATNLKSGNTALIYNAPEELGEDALYLDLGGAVLPGSLNEDGTYTFQGDTKDTEEVGGETIEDTDRDGIDDDTDPMVDADGDGVDDDLDQDVDTDGDGIDDRFGDDMVDVDGDGEDDRFTYLPSDTKVTQKVTLTVDLTLDGDHLYGPSGATTTPSRQGSKCAGLAGYKGTSTTAFVGVEVDPESVSLPVSGDQ